MKTIKEKKLLEKLKNRKKRIHFLKGVGQIILPKIYSFKQKRNMINLLCDGERIRSFPNPKNVTIQAIKDYISTYKVLKDYCGAPASTCHQFENCSRCHSLHKKWAEERREKKEKIIKPKPGDILERGKALNSISKKIFFSRTHGLSWK